MEWNCITPVHYSSISNYRRSSPLIVLIKGTDWYYSIGLARGNHPIPFGKYVFYYEIAISENGIASEDL